MTRFFRSASDWSAPFSGSVLPFQRDRVDILTTELDADDALSFYPELKRLADQLLWLDEATARPVGTVDAAASPVADSACAANCLVMDALQRCLGREDCNGGRLLEEFSAEVRSYLLPCRLTTDFEQVSMPVTDAIPVAWWLAMLLLPVATVYRVAGHYPEFEVIARQVSGRTELIVTETQYISLAEVARQIEPRLAQARERFNGHQSVLAGLWGSLVHLRFNAS